MELGYRLSPHVYAHAPGSPRLEVNLYGLPTLQHFDPRKMVLKVRSLKGLPTDLAITPPWDFFDTYQACVGHVVLYDRKDKRVNLYTYGGDLKIHNEGDKTHCVLESEAPIMILGELSGFATILADETEILIAEAFANSEHDTEHFLSRLASVKPLQMYASCLKAIDEKYEAPEYLEVPHIVEFHKFIQKEIASLKVEKLWPSDVPKFDGLVTSAGSY